MKTLVVIIFLMLVKGVAGQTSSELVITAGTIVSEVLTPDKIYQHPQFTLGKVLYRNGTETEALLNYNNLSGDIEFIGPKKDTLVIGKDLLPTIKKIMINGHTYFYQEGYFEQVEENAFGKLLKRQVYMVLNREKMGPITNILLLSAKKYWKLQLNLKTLWGACLIYNRPHHLMRTKMIIDSRKRRL